VLKTLCRRLKEKDKENREGDRLLFDIVAGTSIGAMNGAVLVRRYLETERWDDEHLLMLFTLIRYSENT
jgi:predicted acylesterase/phospholipase RssA